MDKESIIKKIIQHKKQPNLRYRLKHNVESFTDRLFFMLFDIETPVEENLDILESEFDELVRLACWQVETPCKKVWNNYMAKIPTILEKLNLDAEAIVNCDPASLSIEEVYMAYPGFYAIAIYRLAHELYEEGFPMVPRLMTEYAHSQTGVDINPGAKIGDSFFIDHAKNLQNTKRHPTIENNVTIYANATILGGKTVIGENSIIGGNAWITSSIPPNSTVYHKPEIKIKTITNGS